jgi:DNA-directed RNA polymerase specialized sigma24 family protein
VTPFDALLGVGLHRAAALLVREGCAKVRDEQPSPFPVEGSVRLRDTAEQWAWSGEFDRFVADVRPRLVRAFVGSVGVSDAADAAAEALAYAFEHWERVRAMDNPAGYLYRVGRSRVRSRKRPSLPAPATLGLPDIEPRLIPALVGLPESQRTAVWLVHACQWRYSEVAEAMHISVSMVGNNVRRGLEGLRRSLGVTDDE